jgi:hypothetical protein
VIGGSWKRTSREKLRLALSRWRCSLLFYAILHDITTVSRGEDWDDNLFSLTTFRISLASPCVSLHFILDDIYGLFNGAARPRDFDHDFFKSSHRRFGCLSMLCLSI